MDIRTELIERFFRYAAIASQSDARSPLLPSSSGQMELARLLASELQAMRIDDVVFDDSAIVTGVKRGKMPDAPRIGFIAHLDTADVGLSPIVKPKIHRFEGGDLCLNIDEAIWLRVDEHPEIRGWQGQDIITSDGTSVLGADNKAAIAVIMTLLEHLEDQGPHGDVYVAFVPDEEIGLRGARALDLARFPCDFAYTIDCCEIGEIALDNFDAASGKIIFKGVSAHPMAAKDILVNPLLMAVDFINHFDRMDTPEHTDNREGFFWFSDLVADDSSATLEVLIRDFDQSRFDWRKRTIATVAEALRLQYPTGTIEYKLADTYRNFGPSLSKDPRAAKLVFMALDKIGIEAKLIAMRGGTDGAILSERGIPTPNIFTGAHNFHSRFEFLPIPAFVKSFELAVAICCFATSPSNNI